MEIVPLTGRFGAEIFSADLRDETQFEDIRAAFIEHSVIVLREQHITPEDHLAFARRFRPINVNRFFKAHDLHPEVAMVIKEPDQKRAIGEQWHTDHSYDEQPALASILHAVETPETGGDTVFCAMTLAFAELSEPMKNFLKTLHATHGSEQAFGASQQQSETSRTGRIGNSASANQIARHPVIIRHPWSGRESLYVNPQFTTGIEGLNDQESDAMLRMLFDHCQKPEYQCRVRWRPGDVTMWDNLATWHRAINDYEGHRRIMHRVTLEGIPLQAAG